MSPDVAAAYHRPQIEDFAAAGADLVTSMTTTNANEAIGIVSAAKNAGMPAVISFTVETDGRLPTGQSLWDAIDAVDRATDKAAAYFMINCAHPTHFEDTLEHGGAALPRLRGLRSNASCLSHAELDASETLDTGNPAELGHQHAHILGRYPHINVLGGCCGTDHRHIEEISKVVRNPYKTAA